MVVLLDGSTRNTLPAVKNIAAIIGPGGMAAYSDRQDLLLLSDFYSAFSVDKASIYFDPEMLSYITECARVHGIWPGAQILHSWNEDYDSLLEYPSAAAEKSSFMHDVGNLLLDQRGADKNARLPASAGPYKKTYPSKGAELAEIKFPSNKKVLIRSEYIPVLTEYEPVEIWSSITREQREPTSSWRSLSFEEKGIYVEIGPHLCGVIMPYA